MSGGSRSRRREAVEVPRSTRSRARLHSGYSALANGTLTGYLRTWFPVTANDIVFCPVWNRKLIGD